MRHHALGYLLIIHYCRDFLTTNGKQHVTPSAHRQSLVDIQQSKAVAQITAGRLLRLLGRILPGRGFNPYCSAAAKVL